MRASAWVAGGVAALALVACGAGTGSTRAAGAVGSTAVRASEAPSTAAAATTAVPSRPAPVGGVRVVAVGDIACEPGAAATPLTCQQSATATLARRLKPAAALLLGDLQYETGAASEWASFGASWGKLGVPLYPAPGNHEYATIGAGAYYDYFGARAGPARRGWYAFNLGGWRLYSLNANCATVGCSAGSAQERWLRSDLAAHPRACVGAYWHQARFSSGLHGDDDGPAPLWAALQSAHADLVLEGHDHDYERFDRRLAGGAVNTRGVASFVVGTGGKTFYPVIRREPGSRKVVVGRFGVLSLTLGKGAWAWKYVTVGGQTLDRGTQRCS